MIAVVLVNYNGAEDTIDCIQSLQQLQYKDYKIVVVDNKSTDDSINKLSSFDTKGIIKLLKADENNGFSAGNNIGIQYALDVLHADYIWLLNNDTVVMPESLSELLKGFESDNNIGITTAKTFYWSNKSMIWYAGGAINNKTSRTEHWRYGEIEKKECPRLERNTPVTFISGCCMLIKREVFEKVGNLDEDYFLYDEDSDFCLRTTAAGYTLMYCPNAVIYHKVSASTGKITGIAQYYSVRNKLWLIKKNFKGINNLIALCYANLQMWFRCMKHEIEWKYYKKGLNSYLSGEKGKSTIKL